MSLFKILLYPFFLIIVSCNQIDFIYSESKNLTNPVYNNVNYRFAGDNIPGIYMQASRYLGVSNAANYELIITTKENKTKRSVESNQAVAKLDYEIVYNYSLKKAGSECVIFDKKTYSRFSYVPKSSGYNFGSDQSLDKMYELASRKSLELFVNDVRNINMDVCNDEG